jgi:tetratricopeptide (TPR) repeat protein
MDSDVNHRKPKLVFFQWDHQPNASAAGYLLLHMQQQVKCLSTHFEVVVINRDCDYAEICERHEPDLTLFESGYRSHGSRRIKITNTNAHPTIPKIGLHNADPWCDRRSGFLSDMEQWGIETYFSIATLAPEYMPGLDGKLFVWPNFIDPDVYKDYHQHKIIPATLTGQVNGLYPWRQRVFPVIRDRYPCLVSPQHTYESKLAAQLLSGEAYARVLNASLIVPTCGTMAGEVVRKHFEIPAARSCLVTERTPALQAAGFVDMENCVFTDDPELVDRLEYLFSHPDEIERITTAGYNLAHSRHTLSDRLQIYQWFTLNKNLRSNEKIIQPGPFENLTKVERASQQVGTRLADGASDRTLLKRADALLGQGKVQEARECYARCLDYVSYLPEAKFGLVICALQEGNIDRAYELIVNLLKVTMIDYGAADPDPVEWAYFLLILICKGDIGQARRLRDFYPSLSHRELRHVDLIFAQAGLEGNRVSGRPGQERKSIHHIPERDDSEWLLWVADILELSHQPDLARALRRDSRSPAEHVRSQRPKVEFDWRRRLYATVDSLMIALRLQRFRPNVPPLPEFSYLRQLARPLFPRSSRGPLRKIRMALSRGLS